MRSREHSRRCHRIEQLETRLALSASELIADADTSLLLHFNGDLIGAAGESPTAQVGITFPNGLLNQGAHVASPGRIRYATAGNIVATEGTIEFWVSPDWNGNTSTNHTFMEVGDNFNNGMILSIDSANNLRCLQWGDDPTTAATEINVERGIGTSGQAWTAGSWHHIAATWRGATRELTFYVDGQSVGSISNGVQIANFSTTYLSIGAEVGSQNSASANFDEFRISSRARSAGEILSDYNRGLGITNAAYPVGLAVNTANQVYVVESAANQVTIYDPSGSPLSIIGTSGSGNGQFNQPWGIGVDSLSNIFVVDRGNNRVQRFTAEGVYVSQFGSFGTAPGQFNSPQGIYVDSIGNKIYVADSGNHRVQRFNMDGTLDTTWGSAGIVGTTGVLKRDHTGFDRPSAIARNPISGEIYIADFGNARLEVFSTSGTYLRTYNAVYRPNALAFNGAGDLYIAGEDPNNNFNPYDGRLRILKAGDSLIGDHFTGGYDDLGRTLLGVAVRPDGRLLIADPVNGRIVQTNTQFEESVSDLTIVAHGTTATFRWKTALPSASKVRYGVTNSYGSLVVDASVTTDHVVTINDLNPNTRLFYGVSFADSFDGNERFTPQDVMNTGAPLGSAQFQRIKAVGMIYTDTQAGSGYTAMSAAALSAAYTRFARVSDFYWRNSGFRLWLDIQVVEVNRDITTTTASLFSFMQIDLAAMGFSAANDLDAAWATSTLADGNFGGGGSLFGRTVGMSEWATQDDFVAIHEVNHSIDSIYDASNISKYQFNHGIWAVPGGVGGDISINGQILRNLLPVNFAAIKAPFTKVMTAPDSDNDGIPDVSPSGLTHPLSITEMTLNSSTSSTDTDGDGVSDLAEAMALPFDNTNLNVPDSDGDGRPDSSDLNPNYRMNDHIWKASPTINGTINLADGWTILTDHWGYSNTALVTDSNSLQSQTTTYAAWDDQYFYLALQGPANSTHIRLDGDADNWFIGSDNYDLTLSNSTTSRSVKINVGVPDLFRQIDDDGQYAEFFDTDSKFTKAYNGRPFYNQANEGAGFAGRLVTEANLVYQRGGAGNDRVWEVAIPWSNVTGFHGFAGKEMALSIDVGSDRLFSVDHAAKIRLIASNAPIADAGGAYSLFEGGSLLLNAGASTDPDLSYGDALSYSWDVNGDGLFGDAVGVNPILTWQDLISLGLSDDGAFENIRVQVSDLFGGSTISAATSLLLNNSAPTTSLAGLADSVRGEVQSFTLTANDPSPADQASAFTFNIDWDGDGIYDEAVIGPSGTIVSHEFKLSGLFSVHVTATDKDSSTSAVASTVVSVTDWALRANADQPALLDLVWGGTPGNDAVSFEQTGSSQITIRTSLVNGQLVSGLEVVNNVTGIVRAFGRKGHDSLSAESLTTKIAQLVGDGGNDTITGSNNADILYGDGDGAEGGADSIQGNDGDDVIIADGPEGLADTIIGGNGDDMIVSDPDGGEGGDDLVFGNEGNDIIETDAGADSVEGGSGDDILLGLGDPTGVQRNADTLIGGDGRDIIVGGVGSDSMIGGSGEDLIIAGSIDPSFLINSWAGMRALRAAWSTAESTLARQNNILGGPGSTVPANYVLGSGIVLDDDAIDYIISNDDTDADWIFHDFELDVLDSASPDFFTEI